MTTIRPAPISELGKLRHDLYNLLESMADHPQGELIARALRILVQVSQQETERLDWKLIAGALHDMQKAIKVFHPYRHIRKVTIFGSARSAPGDPEYEQAVQFARCITELGFMVLTGAGGGIMAAGNEGAGADRSFGLNIDLPFEQTANEFIRDSERLVNFRYFFTRKLFFLREADAIALFPGGFGTQDECFECLTLCQTGRATPRPLVLIDKPDGDYWVKWDEYMQRYLEERGFISAGDRRLYTITNDIPTACQVISKFYSIYHSSRWVDKTFVIRLNCEISDAHLTRLNAEFADILTDGEITRSPALPKEFKDIEILHLPRLVMNFNQVSYSRLNDLIWAINSVAEEPELSHLTPERK
ncbi:MAG: LOG family protein [Pseudanabaenaceae cyanobacterium]